MPHPSKWIAFADGASSGNPGPGGWGSVISSPTGKVVELGGFDAHTTNNRMELLATIEVLRQVPSTAEVELFTDSKYVINGISGWIWNWIRNGWKTGEGKDVVNRDLWEALNREVQRVGKSTVKFSYVPGHAGIPGNDRVDAIAVSFSKRTPVELFRGDAELYEIDLSIITSSEPKASSKSKKTSKGAGVYLSLIGAKLEKHATWKECEARVKGQSGAKFKKVTSPEEEAATLSSWSVKADYFK